MDTLIAEIQDRNIPLSMLLLKAKVVATKKKDEVFLVWLEKEINGYEKGKSKAPEYRKMHGQAKFWNPMLGWCPIVFNNTEIEKKIVNRSTNQSLAEIEQLLESNSQEFVMPYPASVAEQIMQGEMRTKVSMFIGRSSLVGILGRVRNMVLDWVLNLEEEQVMPEKIIVFEQDNKSKKLKLNLSFSTKQGVMSVTDQNGKEYKVKVQGQVQKEVLRVIFQNPEDTFSEWSLYDISEILGGADVDETAVKNALYQFNKKIQLAVPEVENLFEVNKHSVKLNPKYI